MTPKVWLNGKLFDKGAAALDVYDHGTLYGDGVFEGIRAYNGALFEIDPHLRRLYDSAKAIRLAIPQTPSEMKRAIERTVEAAGASDCYIRVVVTRGIGHLGISPLKCGTVSTFIIVDTISMYPPETYRNGITLITASVVRNHPNALSARIKSLNYLNNILAKIEANDAGADEAIMLNCHGYVAECSADNLFLVRDGVVRTPSEDQCLLAGITRGVILRLCRENGIPVRECVVERHDLYVADECFLTGTGAEVVPVRRIDGRDVGDGRVGPLTSRLIEAFHGHIARVCPRR